MNGCGWGVCFTHVSGLFVTEHNASNTAPSHSSGSFSVLDFVLPLHIELKWLFSPQHWHVCQYTGHSSILNLTAPPFRVLFFCHSRHNCLLLDRFSKLLNTCSFLFRYELDAAFPPSESKMQNVYRLPLPKQHAVNSDPYHHCIFFMDSVMEIALNTTSSVLSVSDPPHDRVRYRLSALSQHSSSCPVFAWSARRDCRSFNILYFCYDGRLYWLDEKVSIQKSYNITVIMLRVYWVNDHIQLISTINEHEL